MASPMSNSAIGAENRAKTNIVSFLAGRLISGGFDSKECEPISDIEFKMLMVIVVVSTFAFGCIVNGWLL